MFVNISAWPRTPSIRKGNDRFWNPAGVCFYEHVFDLKRIVWRDVVPWISPRVIEDCWGLWERRLTGEELERLKELFAKRRRLLYREARLMLGLRPD